MAHLQNVCFYEKHAACIFFIEQWCYATEIWMMADHFTWFPSIHLFSLAFIQFKVAGSWRGNWTPTSCAEVKTWNHNTTAAAGIGDFHQNIFFFMVQEGWYMWNILPLHNDSNVNNEKMHKQKSWSDTFIFLHLSRTTYWSVEIERIIHVPFPPQSFMEMAYSSTFTFALHIKKKDFVFTCLKGKPSPKFFLQ